MSLGEKKLTAEEFEALLAAQRRRAAVGNLLPIDQLTSASTTAPPPGRYELRPLVSCDVPTLSKSGDPATTGDQVHLSAHATDSLYMTGSLGTIAIALQQPAVRWSYPVRPDRTHAQNPERMTSAGDRLFWCRPTTGGLELTCLDAATGAVKWHKRHPDLPVISDPVWSQKQLLAVKADPPGQGVRRIALCELNPETGETISQTDIGGLISQETTDPPCALAAIDERLILATAAGVLCCDRSGQVHWLQRSIWLTPEVHDLATKARVEMALIVQSNGPVIVLQSGAAGLQAFDPETGRRVWQRATPDLTRVVGAAGGLIVAKTPRGLLAYQAADGAFVWQRDLPASPFACGLCHDGQVAIASAQPDENGKQWLSLQWISGSDNLEEKKASIELPEQRITSVIGLGAIAGRFFIVGYDKEHSAARLLELVPVVTEKP